MVAEGISPEGDLREIGRVRTQSRVTMPLNLARVNEAARRDKSTRFTALLHHVDGSALERAFRRLKRSAAPGVDGETVASYEQELAQNLERLHAQIHSGRYRPQPVYEVDFLGFSYGFGPAVARIRPLRRCTRR